MNIRDGKDNPVSPTLKAIHDAIEDTGSVKTHPGYVSLVRQDCGESYIVIDRYNEVPESETYGSIDEAYARFRFLVGAYFKVNLPSL
jgi:hypothetical protein